MTYHKLAQIQMATMSIQINWKCTDTTVHLNNWQQGKNTSKGHVQNRRNPHKSQRESLCVVSIRCENLRFTEKREKNWSGIITLTQLPTIPALLKTSPGLKLIYKLEGHSYYMNSAWHRLPSSFLSSANKKLKVLRWCQQHQDEIFLSLPWAGTCEFLKLRSSGQRPRGCVFYTNMLKQ